MTWNTSECVTVAGLGLEIDAGVAAAQVNEFVKRVRAAKIHCLIMGHLRKQMPAMMGKAKAQEKLLRELQQHFAHVQREHHLPPGAPLHHFRTPPLLSVVPALQLACRMHRLQCGPACMQVCKLLSWRLAIRQGQRKRTMCWIANAWSSKRCAKRR
jgi:hypothetical protein